MIVWHLLSDPDARYHDLGSDFYAARIDPERRKRGHIRQLEALGYQVTLARRLKPPDEEPGSAGLPRAK